MTKLRHHPQGETLMSYAAGTLDPAFSLIMSCHLQFCGECRRSLRTMEDLGGLLLERVIFQEDEAFLARTMKRFSHESAQNVGTVAHWGTPDAGNEAVMPAPLAHATGLRRETIPWNAASDGSRKFDLPNLAGAAASAHIVNIEPGAVLHSQRHGGQLVLVLWGAYDYDGGRFERGDLHDISASGFKTFSGAGPEGVTFVTAISPVPQFEVFRTAH